MNSKFLMHTLLIILSGVTFLFMSGCSDSNWNNPHKKQDIRSNVYFSSFDAPPKTLDPARAYSTNESLFISQIYEPPLQYHLLKRPYTLIPLTSMDLPKTVYFDKNGKKLSNDANIKEIAFTTYTIKIKPGVKFQPHPAFAKDKKGKYLYHELDENDLKSIYSLSDFTENGTRELVAQDFVYQIKRIADPKVQSPIFGVMSNHIMGLMDYYKNTNEFYKENGTGYVNHNDFELVGATVIDRYTYQIKVKGKYPQFLYWLAMPFFSPVPWEADRFYSQSGLQQKNITFDWYPVGTGPYMLSKNNPNSEMELVRNPNFRVEYHPSQKVKGRLPFIDVFHFSLEKESIPRWNKFLQGYYDQSGIASDVFDQAIEINEFNEPILSDELKDKNMKLNSSVSLGIYYIGFNMLDDTVGGYSPKAKKLRQAISIVLDQEEFISIFLNGRGIVAHGPIPEGIFGYKEGKEGMNPYVYHWHDNKAQRKSLAEAKKLLAQAGYPNGRDAKTGKPLVLNFDVPMSGGVDDKARFAWMRKQFAKLGIQLQIRATQYNRFQDKMKTGNAQIYFWGWMADYPDPENFLFLLYGPNSKVKVGGENASNYQNKEFDRLFLKMKDMPNNAQRQKVINQMLTILQEDSPWVWGFFPKNLSLAHEWVGVVKPHAVASNTLKYMKLKPELRKKLASSWNNPTLWPIVALIVIIILLITPVVIYYIRKEHKPLERV